MISSVNKYIFLTIFTASAFSAGAMDTPEKKQLMENAHAEIRKKAQETSATIQSLLHKRQENSHNKADEPPAKVRKITASPHYLSAIPVTQAQVNASPFTTAMALHEAKCPPAPKQSLKVTQNDLTKSKKRSRKALALNDEATEQMPPQKIQRPDKPEQSDAVQKVFTSDIVLDLLKKLPTSDWPSFARISCICNAATQELKEKALAEKLAKSKFSPITYVLEKAKGQPTVRFYGITFRTNALIIALLSIVDPLNELPQNSYGCMQTDKIDGVVVPQELNHLLPAEKLRSRKSVKCLHVNLDEGEGKVIEHVKTVAAQYPDYNIDLEFDTPNDILSSQSDVKESFINKLAQCKGGTQITSIHFDSHYFPQGVACLAKLKSLKEVYLQSCAIVGEDIPEQFFTGLPSLNVLDIDDTDIQSISPSINCLKNLVVLHLTNNELRELPSLKNLQQLKVLHIHQNFNFSGEQLAQALPDATGLLDLSLAYVGDQNPLPDGCHLHHLISLKLIGKTKPLIDRIDELKKLAKLELIDITETELPLCITKLHALTSFAADLDDDVTIDHLVFNTIVQHVKSCTLFINGEDQTENLKTLAELWNKAKASRMFQNNKLFQISEEQRLKHKEEYGLILYLQNSAKLTTGEIRKFVTTDLELVKQAIKFIDEL